ncbi:RtcB family protein [Desertimonas flava]|uniref:RtcB family protein n=1 Tax=Desertimonas flava TaxID=2064846 RepID=UPI000E352584|nr:RtcB family protein [Desertimonas flava]
MPIQLNPRLLSWAPDLEDSARDQAVNTSKLPFLAGHVALMPDAHWGMGATVGSVIPTEGAIVPAAVGVDIGCGMIAARTDLTSHDLPDDLDRLHAMIGEGIPHGAGQQHDDGRSIPPTNGASVALTHRLFDKAQHQMGTLGGGNHFVEVCLDELDRVWIVLHSGSRGVGKELAEVHIDKAKGLMKSYFIDLPDPDLAYLAEGTPEFADYIGDMLWAQRYAMRNREQMLMAAHEAFDDFLGRGVVIEDVINCHHNFTEREHHRGRNVWLTRKGAIRARTGDRGVIPGSMGAASYIVSGLGNPASYDSCSHGAGRRMSRAKAFATFTADSLIEAMAGKAWNGAGEAADLVDEHPGSYKDIDEVMANQADLVTVEHTLHQILNLKGKDDRNRRRRKGRR